MALSELKQTEAEIQQFGVVSAKDRLEGSAKENKEVFDRLFRNVGAAKFNALIDELMSDAAAAQIGIEKIPGLTGAEDVQAALKKMVELLQGISQGAVADGSITEPKYADNSIPNRALQSNSVGTDNVQGGSITEPKYADASIPERAFQPETVGGEALKPESVNTKHYAKKSIGFEQLDDLCVGPENVRPGAITGDKVAEATLTTEKHQNESITREKLANDAKYSVVVGVHSSREITAEDSGRTLLINAGTNDVVLNVSVSNNASIPNTAEIAIVNYVSGSAKITFESPLRILVLGETQEISGGSVIITDKYGMVALKKLFTSANGDVWIITGNVEVV